MNPAADHHVLQLTSLNQMANLTLGNANARSKLLWRLQPIIQLA
jgi:hypothetical protein